MNKINYEGILHLIKLNSYINFLIADILSDQREEAKRSVTKIKESYGQLDKIFNVINNMEVKHEEKVKGNCNGSCQCGDV